MLSKLLIIVNQYRFEDLLIWEENEGKGVSLNINI